ncbi:MAG: hypothetical protein AAF660_05480 [Pseudomonadota bacterium]
MASHADLLVQRIRSLDASVTHELAQIDNPCIEDSEQCSLLAAAVRSGFDAAVTALTQHRVAIDYVPALSSDQQSTMRQISSLASYDNIDEAEAYASQPFGGLGHFARTPLLEACRIGNRFALKHLLAAGASAASTDVLGETALSLAAYRDVDFLVFTINALVEAGRTFKVDEALLEKAAAAPTAFDALGRHGALDNDACHLLLCMRCALLDENGVRELAEDYSLTQKRPLHRDPIREALCSDLLVRVGHPEKHTLAAGLSRVFERTGADPSPMSPDERERRLAMVQLLQDLGLNPRQGNPRDAMEFLDRVITTNEPALLQTIAELGVVFDKHQLKWDNRIDFAVEHRCFAAVAALPALGIKAPTQTGAAFDDYLRWCEAQSVTPVKPAQAKKAARKRGGEKTTEATVEQVPGFRALLDAPSTWESVGESRLVAARVDTGDGPILRLTYSNLYGPVDGVAIAVRYRRNPWKDAKRVEELVDIDGTARLRDDAGDLTGETPWHATFEVDYPLPKGEFVVEIQLYSPAEGIDPPRVIDDWTVRVDRG